MKYAEKLFKDPIKCGSLEKKLYPRYESNIEPFIRFIHTRNIKPVGWISIDDYEICDPPESRCQ